MFLAIVASGFLFLRPAASPLEMLACLPPGDAPVLYVDVRLLRNTGLLDRIAGPAGSEEAEYTKLVDATGFNYRRDLDAALLEFRPDSTFLVARGRFDMARLGAYAGEHGGQCAGDFCSMPGSSEGKHISFSPLAGSRSSIFEPRMFALAIGPAAMGAASIRANGAIPAFDPPPAPVWLSLPSSSFHSVSDLPQGLSAFLEALAGAERATLSIEVLPAGLEVDLIAACPKPAVAQEIAARLMRATDVLRDLIAHSGKPPEDTSPAVLLSAGTFRADQSIVHGKWPVSKAFLDSLGR